MKYFNSQVEDDIVFLVALVEKELLKERKPPKGGKRKKVGRSARCPINGTEVCIYESDVRLEKV